MWPDVYPAVQLFIDVLTQWRVSMTGLTGIDYIALFAVMDIRDIPRAERSAMFDDIREMEGAVLAHVRRQK